MHLCLADKRIKWRSQLRRHRTGHAKGGTWEAASSGHKAVLECGGVHRRGIEARCADRGCGGSLALDREYSGAESNAIRAGDVEAGKPCDACLRFGSQTQSQTVWKSA